AFMSFGYSDGILAHDPNLAEGLPTKNVPFVVRGMSAVPEEAGRNFVRGDFEEHSGDTFSGWSFQAEPDHGTFADTQVKHGGQASLRIDNLPGVTGNRRVNKKLKVRPWSQYHASVWVRTICHSCRSAKGHENLQLRPIYLDHCSTTPIDPSVLDAMLPFLRESYGNPGTPHEAVGRVVQRAIREAREATAALLNCQADELDVLCVFYHRRWSRGDTFSTSTFLDVIGELTTFAFVVPLPRDPGLRELKHQLRSELTESLATATRETRCWTTLGDCGGSPRTPMSGLVRGVLGRGRTGFRSSAGNRDRLRRSVHDGPDQRRERRSVY
ncbi:MAG: aminotransferase class V-fold PLP-dependent enzyme, partial [Planctomycetota bacterium]